MGEGGVKNRKNCRRCLWMVPCFSVLFGREICFSNFYNFFLCKSIQIRSDCSIRYIFTSLCITALKNDSPSKDSKKSCLYLFMSIFITPPPASDRAALKLRRLARNVDSYILQSLSCGVNKSEIAMQKC